MSQDVTAETKPRLGRPPGVGRVGPTRSVKIQIALTEEEAALVEPALLLLHEAERAAGAAAHSVTSRSLFLSRLLITSLGDSRVLQRTVQELLGLRAAREDAEV